MLKCYNCSSTTFTIKTKYICEACDENGEWDDNEDEFVTKGENLRQVDAEGQCNLGTSYGNGCRMIYCDKCKELIDFIPMKGLI